jgi:hypothetical protein
MSAGVPPVCAYTVLGTVDKKGAHSRVSPLWFLIRNTKCQRAVGLYLRVRVVVFLEYLATTFLSCHSILHYLSLCFPIISGARLLLPVNNVFGRLQMPL